MVSNGRYFLDIPTPKGLRIAAAVVGGSLSLAIVLYALAGKHLEDLLQKIGDSCIQAR